MLDHIYYDKVGSPFSINLFTNERIRWDQSFANNKMIQQLEADLINVSIFQQILAKLGVQSSLNINFNKML